MRRLMMIQAQNTAKEMPANILLEKWADIGFEWAGDVTVASFERLAANVQTEQDGNLDALQVQVKLHKESGVLWLDFVVQGELKTACQRCLELITIDVSGVYRLAVLFRAEQIEQIFDAEYVLVDEFGHQDARKMLPIKDLLEDELLLTLPLSPRHDDCDMPIEMVDEDDEEPLDNPFAALAALKGKLN